MDFLLFVVGIYIGFIGTAALMVGIEMCLSSTMFKRLPRRMTQSDVQLALYAILTLCALTLFVVIVELSWFTAGVLAASTMMLCWPKPLIEDVNYEPFKLMAAEMPALPALVKLLFTCAKHCHATRAPMSDSQAPCQAQTACVDKQDQIESLLLLSMPGGAEKLVDISEQADSLTALLNDATKIRSELAEISQLEPRLSQADVSPETMRALQADMVHKTKVLLERGDACKERKRSLQLALKNLEEARDRLMAQPPSKILKNAKALPSKSDN